MGITKTDFTVETSLNWMVLNLSNFSSHFVVLPYQNGVILEILLY